MATYKMTIAGLERELPICKVNDKLDIAGFVIFGDVEMTVVAAGELIKKCPEFDFIVAPEAKAIPLAHEMARQSGKPYFICRKGAKLYMQSPVSVNVRSITTDKEQTLFMDSLEGEQLRGKRVVILDDVIKCHLVCSVTIIYISTHISINTRSCPKNLLHAYISSIEQRFQLSFCLEVIIFSPCGVRPLFK